MAAYRVKTYIGPYMGDLAVEAVEKDTLRGFRVHLEGLKRPGDEAGTEVRALTDLTVGHILSDARCLLGWAFDTGRIKSLPVPRKLIPRPGELEPRALTADEQATVTALPNPVGFACRIMLRTGVRWSELCRLTSSDVSGEDVIVQGATKSKKLRRIPLAKTLLAELRQHVGKLVPYRGTEDNPAFVRGVQRATGIEHFGAHSLRHSYAFNFIARGGDIQSLKTTMGHADITTTAIYLRGYDPNLEAARKAVGE
jgi:integrase/recombinase XerD